MSGPTTADVALVGAGAALVCAPPLRADVPTLIANEINNTTPSAPNKRACPCSYCFMTLPLQPIILRRERWCRGFAAVAASASNLSLMRMSRVGDLLRGHATAINGSKARGLNACEACVA